MSIIRKFIYLYIDGFRNIGITGKSLVVVLIIKLFIMFAILKIFFFPNFLKTNFESDQERSDYIINQITKTK
ncbi:MAG: DUF4492 domain-containing protein [Bacteroidetes bacterium HGW-Bacteroidetes-21]|nr:MAG: DUF4492 domain-containing protein [Bacteroidetes bacterium HGW-Bacteroidetes-21]